MIRNMSSSKHHTLSKEEEESESSQSEKDGSNVSASEKVELRIHPSLIGMAKPAAESRGENQPAGSQMDKPPVQTTSTSTAAGFAIPIND